MTIEEILADNGYEDLVLFKNPSFESAIIGVSEDNRVIYDYDLMIDAALEEEKDWTVDDAIEWIEFNTIRSLPYIENAPIIMYRLQK